MVRVRFCVYYSPFLMHFQNFILKIWLKSQTFYRRVFLEKLRCVTPAFFFLPLIAIYHSFSDRIYIYIYIYNMLTHSPKVSCSVALICFRSSFLGSELQRRLYKLDDEPACEGSSIFHLFSSLTHNSLIHYCCTQRLLNLNAFNPSLKRSRKLFNQLTSGCISPHWKEKRGDY